MAVRRDLRSGQRNRLRAAGLPKLKVAAIRVDWNPAAQVG